MQRVAILFLVASFALGCGDDSRGTIDLAAPAVDDLSVPADLSPVRDDMFVPVMCGNPPDAFPPKPDVSTFCDGTPLQGTCVQAFFKKVAACFAPPTGCCIGDHDNFGDVTYAWQSGLFQRITWSSQTSPYISLYQDGVLCLKTEPAYNGVPTTFTAGDGSTLTFDQNGDAICPGGTVSLGQNYDACPDIQKLMFPDIPSCPRIRFLPDAFAECCTPYPSSWFSYY